MADFLVVMACLVFVLVVCVVIPTGRNETESPIEERLYRELLKRGHNVIPQAKCGPFRVDLALPEYRIAVECDGKAYHSSKEQIAYDKRRSRYLYRNGYTSVLRFSGSQIYRDPGSCVDRIEKTINKKKRKWIF